MCILQAPLLNRDHREPRLPLRVVSAVPPVRVRPLAPFCMHAAYPVVTEEILQPELQWESSLYMRAKGVQATVLSLDGRSG
jgi:hypothetical protein